MSDSEIDAETHAQLEDVSRETLDRLGQYVALLVQWQKKINLVGGGETDNIWRRHILDSAQLLKLARGIDGPKLDLGSGAGFPGMVLAILGVPEITLIESNARKCVFLRQVARVTETPVKIFQGRAEAFAAPAPARLITARALAPLDKLLDLAFPLLAPDGSCIFLKGASFRQELTESHKRWHMNTEILPSQGDASGRIVIIKGLEPIHADE
ncbi:MAG: 16S rRNA (guanine(527)-N(7))-methyltransferase RsmG [Rhodospirillales bacterium]|jgi:16S rRNA (guanine527-N7)-methyltransferase|nr:16S rRNA (guanine(527)-N(7))-methyltransferase RsmG [Rhodospirillales bacterium]